MSEAFGDGWRAAGIHRQTRYRRDGHATQGGPSGRTVWLVSGIQARRRGRSKGYGRALVEGCTAPLLVP